MTNLGQILAVLDRWYPPATAEAWDAVGLVCGDPDEPVELIHLAVDATPATVDEAIAARAQLLITHHPLLLTGVHGVPTTDPKGALVHRMIRAGLAHYVAHTNADVAAPGVSDALAHRLGLTGLTPLEPLTDAAHSSTDRSDGDHLGLGRIGDLPEPTTLGDFIRFCAERLPATQPGLRAAGSPARRVARVAVCGGSGGSLIETARTAGADVFVTADLKHHAVLEAVAERGGDGLSGLALVDAAHWATEAPWLDELAVRLGQHVGGALDTGLKIAVSRLVTDPWTLHAPSPESSPSAL